MGETLPELLTLAALAVGLRESMPRSEALALGDGLGDSLGLALEESEAAPEAEALAQALPVGEGVTRALLPEGCSESEGWLVGVEGSVG